jgi:hypothetical protein
MAIFSFMRLQIKQLRKLIREEIENQGYTRHMEQPNKKFHVFYHPESQDNNGNGGPNWPDSRWQMIEVSEKYPRQEAYNKLPKEDQIHIQKGISLFNKRNDSDYTTSQIEQFTEDTCQWNVGFSLAVMEYGEMDEYIDDGFHYNDYV